MSSEGSVPLMNKNILRVLSQSVSGSGCAESGSENESVVESKLLAGLQMRVLFLFLSPLSLAFTRVLLSANPLPRILPFSLGFYCFV